MMMRWWDGEIGGVRIRDADELDCIRYAHIDMASVMLTTDDSGYNVKGMSGKWLLLIFLHFFN